jgi:preprotein translocase subunit SecG
MGFLIGLLTVVMVLNCVALILLVLIQLPKKDAGAGLAFGGAATDALFGAGSGNVLTKITKYAATVFFGLALVLSVMQRYYHTRNTSEFGAKLGQAAPMQSGPSSASQPTTPSPTPQSPASKPAASAGNNNLRVVTPAAESPNLAVPIAPAPATTNAPK